MKEVSLSVGYAKFGGSNPGGAPCCLLMLLVAVINFFANWFRDAAADNRLLIVLGHAIGDKINTLPMIASGVGEIAGGRLAFARVSVLLWSGISH